MNTKENSRNSLKTIDSFFASKPTTNQKAWGVINKFYHYILVYMKQENISKAELARKTGKSRSAITQMFNKTPNLTIKKMVEISDAIGFEFEIVPVKEIKQIQDVREIKFNIFSKENYKIKSEKSFASLIIPFNRSKICECPDITAQQKQYVN